MRILKQITLAALLAATSGAAQAAVTLVNPPVDGIYRQLGGVVGPGVYGVETRRGNNATNGTWEIGAGTQTSNAGTFDQGQLTWNNTDHAFTLTWNAAILSITVDDVTVDYAAPLLGDTLRVFAKRDATFFIDMIDGVNFDIAITGNPSGSATTPGQAELYFYSADNWGGDGFVANGTLRVGGASGANSASGVEFKNGDFEPFLVPAPGALALFGMGLAGIGLGRMRRPD